MKMLRHVQWMRRRSVILAVIIVAACATNANLLDDSGAPIAVKHARVSRNVRERVPDFWTAVSVLDVNAATQDANTISERVFARALGLLTSGDLDGAEVLFGSLLEDPDVLIRGRARIGMTLSLGAQGRWTSLAALPRVSVSPTDTQYVDRAAVDAWAGVLRDVPPVEITAPAAPDTDDITRSSIGTPIVSVVLNGHRRHFWLDTGASMSLIASDVAAACGVRPFGGDTLAIAAATARVAARPAVAAELDIGKVVVRNLPVAILDPSALRLDTRVANGRAEAVKIDGVVGSDVLRRLNVVLDVSAGTVALSRPMGKPLRDRTLLWLGFPVVRLLTRDGQPVLFGIDTGADTSIVTSAWLSKTPDPQLATGHATLQGIGGGGVTALPIVHRVVISDGTYALRLLDVPLVRERRQTFVAFDGVIGANVLSRASIRMDMTDGVFEIRSPGLSLLSSDTGFVRVRRQ